MDRYMCSNQITHLSAINFIGDDAGLYCRMMRSCLLHSSKINSLNHSGSIMNSGIIFPIIFFSGKDRRERSTCSKETAEIASMKKIKIEISALKNNFFLDKKKLI
jgi:hypothetical protein